MNTLETDENLKPKHVSKPRRQANEYAAFADAFFTSTQRRLLTLLFSHPERSFYARELIALAGAGSGAVQRELKAFETCGIVTVTRIGNQKHYQANVNAPVFPELHGLIIKSFGIADRLRRALLSLNVPIMCAFIYGSVAKGNLHGGSDIDIMMVSDALRLDEIFGVLQPEELQLGRKINPTLYTSEEFSKRKESGNPFLTKVLGGTIIPLIGELNVGS